MQRKYRGYWLRGCRTGSPVGASWEMIPKRPNNFFASIDVSGQVNRIGRVHNAGSLKNNAQKKPRRCCIKERDGNVTYSDTISGRTGDGRDSDHHAVVRSRYQLRTRGKAFSALIAVMA